MWDASSASSKPVSLGSGMVTGRSGHVRDLGGRDFCAPSLSPLSTDMSGMSQLIMSIVKPEILKNPQIDLFVISSIF